MSWFSDYFKGGKNPADAANKYISQIPGQTNQFYQPWYQAGQRAIPGLEEQYKHLTGDPGKRMNEIGQAYQQSPGLQFAIQQGLQGAGHAAAAGGMAGSPEHEQQNIQLATDLTNQDYYKWLNNALGLYQEGLHGEQNMSEQGRQSGQSLADMIAQTLAQQGNAAFQGQRQQNQNRNDAFNNVFKAAGAAGSYFTGGGGAFPGFKGMSSGMFGGS